MRPFPVIALALVCGCALLAYNAQHTVVVSLARGGQSTANLAGIRQVKQVRVAALPVDPEGKPLDVLKETHRNWQVRVENPNALERRIPCGHAQADIFNELGVKAVQTLVNGDHRAAAADAGGLAEAAAFFDRAAGFAPGCPVPLLNAAIVRFALDDLPAAREAVDAALARNQTALAASPGLWAKALLFSGLVAERGQRAEDGGPEARYKQAIARRPELALDYFGMKPAAVARQKALALVTTRAKRGHAVIVAAMRKLLLAKEFLRWFGGHAAIQRAEAQEWPRRWFFLARRVLPPFVLTTVQQCYRDLISNGDLKFKDPQALRFFSYTDPVGRYLQTMLRDLVERVADEPVLPTYTYFGGYVSGAVLKPHTDRMQCEFSVTLHIDVNPADAYCPLGIGVKARPNVVPLFMGSDDEVLPPPEQQVYVYPKPGDGLLFKGRHLVHWRQQIPEWQNCSNIFLHYVATDFRHSLA